MDGNCSTCKFSYEKWKTGGIYGECRKNPPVSGVENIRVFPFVYNDDWCGEYEMEYIASFDNSKVHREDFLHSMVAGIKATRPYKDDESVNCKLCGFRHPASLNCTDTGQGCVDCEVDLMPYERWQVVDGQDIKYPLCVICVDKKGPGKVVMTG